MNEEKDCSDFFDNYGALERNVLVRIYEKAILNCVAAMQEDGSVREFGSDIATIGFFVNRFKGE
jgi:hypothetical protein